MSGGNQDRGASHLIERAAERLRRDGAAAAVLGGSAATSLDEDRTFRADAPAPARPPAADPEAPPAPAAAPNFSPPHAAALPAPGLRAPGLHAPGLHAPGLHAPGRGAAPVPPLDMAAMIAAGMIDWSTARTRLSEEFRVVQAQVLRTAFAADPETSFADPGRAAESRQAGNVVMITSARPREGKSFTSLNLAASIARQRDRDVLLVDIDSKRDSLSDQLGLRGRPGLMELATDPRIDPQDLVVATEMTHLTILPFGASGNGAELLASRQMARVIRNLGRRFADRMVILDAPPALASSDASAVAPIVGQIVFVVEAEQTQRPEVEAALDLIQSCPTITLLLNKVQLRSRHTFGGYYSTYTYN